MDDTKHRALHNDFASLLRRVDWDQTPEESIANDLVHLVVLHGLLPEDNSGTTRRAH